MREKNVDLHPRDAFLLLPPPEAQSQRRMLFVTGNMGSEVGK
jgi:hypothetical protein